MQGSARLLERRVWLSLAALGRKEIHQEASAFLGQYAGRSRNSVIEYVGVDEIETAARRSSFWIGRSVDEMPKSAVDECAGAHHARFEGDDQRAVIESPVADCRCGVTKCENFGVCGRIAGQLAFVVSSGDDLAASNHHGPDRNVVMGQGGASLDERGSHRPLYHDHVRVELQRLG